MLVRTEKINSKTIVMIVDELERYIGMIHLGVFHKHCLEKEDTVEIDDYQYYTVNKEKILKYCKK